MVSAMASAMRRCAALAPAPAALAAARRCMSTTPYPTPMLNTPPLASTYDIVILGGGHNGLVAAAYLTRLAPHLRVAVFERRHVLGGAAITEEIHPGFRYSRASYLFSLFRPRIVEELELRRHGLELLLRNPSSFTPMLSRDAQGRSQSLLLGMDTAENQRAIARFSVRDADAYPRYERELSQLVNMIEPLLDSAPFGVSRSLSERWDQARLAYELASRARTLGWPGLLSLQEFLTAPASRILDRWFESEPLKSTLATDAIIGAMTSPSVPGSGYVLFHHVMGEADGHKGAWAYVRGGMGAVSSAIASSARATGAHLFTNAEVKEIVVDGNEAKGVVLASGEVIHCSKVISNISPVTTFLRLCPPRSLPADFHQHIASTDTTSPVTKINLSLDRLPDFACLPSTHSDTHPQHCGTIHFAEHCNQIEEAYRDALQGIPSRTPIVEMTLPSALDTTLAPPGKHVASLFCQYTPYHIAGGWTPAAREAFARTVFSTIEAYCPGFTSSILHYEVLPPPELERIFGLTGGNIFHTSMGIEQLFWRRPAPGWSRYRTPLEHLYVGGAGCHPGGGVMGSAGRLVAQTVLHDWKQEKRK